MMHQQQQQTKIKIAANLGIISRPGQKPNWGKGIEESQFTDWQKKTRSELTYRLSNIEATPQRVADIIALGGTITAWHNPPRSNSGFILAQHIGADFDKLESIAQIVDNSLVRRYGSIIYHTPSSTPQKPKMRVIFFLDEPIIAGPLYRQLVMAMQWKFREYAEPDPACKDYCRLFYGNQGCSPQVLDNVLPTATALSWHEERLASLPPVPAPAPSRVIRPGQAVYSYEERRRAAFAQAVLSKACQKVSEAGEGSRHYTLVSQAYNIGSFVRGAVIDRQMAFEALLRAYPNTGGDGAKAIEWGFDNAPVQGLPVPKMVFRPRPRPAGNSIRIEFKQKQKATVS